MSTNAEVFNYFAARMKALQKQLKGITPKEIEAFPESTIEVFREIGDTLELHRTLLSFEIAFTRKECFNPTTATSTGATI